MESRDLKTALHWGNRILSEHGIQNAQYDSFMLLSDILKIDKAYYYLHQDEELSLESDEIYKNNIQKRALHVPLQHILGYEEFFGYCFYVNRHVLIPRQDTEILTEECIKKISAGSRVLDMCTGSGCIAVTLALQTKAGYILGTDISPEALQVAEYNRNHLKADSVELIESDLFDKINIKENDKFDIIVSNPPYIRTQDIKNLEPEVREHDPLTALDGHEDGLFFYKEIIKQSVRYLKPGGYLLFEIGYDQAEAVCMLMQKQEYSNIKTVKDLSGLDRVVFGEY